MKKIFTTILMSLICLTYVGAKAEEKTMTDKKVLVAYFSATGVTAKVAEKLSKVTGGDLFEIKPSTPYSNADLNWLDKQSRSSIEMSDHRSRPEIATKVENIEKYDVIFVGFPIWWYREPSIIDTFMESYDFSGKMIVPFATSGGSSIGQCGENMQKLAPDAKVFMGDRFQSKVSEEELKSWAEVWL